MSDGSSIGEDLDYEYEYEDEYTYDEDIEEDLPNPPQLTRQVSYTCVASDTVMDEIRKVQAPVHLVWLKVYSCSLWTK